MSDQINERKYDHIRIITSDENVDRKKSYFDFIHLKHRALPEIDLAQVDPSVTFMGKKLAFPLLISSMTGGHHDMVRRINKNLAIAAEETGVAMGVGSQRVMFDNPDARKSFEIRQYAPSILLFANLGAVQLNYGFDISHCREAVAVAGADGLYLHLNPLQEAVQPEGDTNFSNLATKIGEITKNLDVPVILKEVGAGLGLDDVILANEHGVKYFDVAGSGGTSWSRIEHYRRNDEKENIGLLFQDWGNPTPLALRALRPMHDKITVISSGGLRSGIDMAKSVILGAKLCGMAKPFLKPATQSADAVIHTIEKFKKEFTVAMFLLGVRNFDQLFLNESLISQRSEWQLEIVNLYDE